jgi:hypothetical protein
MKIFFGVHTIKNYPKLRIKRKPRRISLDEIRAKNYSKMFCLRPGCRQDDGIPHNSFLFMLK